MDDPPRGVRRVGDRPDDRGRITARGAAVVRRLYKTARRRLYIWTNAFPIRAECVKLPRDRRRPEETGDGAGRCRRSWARAARGPPPPRRSPARAAAWCVLDRMRFPSDQLSTHVAAAERRQRARAASARCRAILALNSVARSAWVAARGRGTRCATSACGPPTTAPTSALCVPRDLQDVELVEAVREQGAEVREGCTVDDGPLARRPRLRGALPRRRRRRRARSARQLVDRRRRPALDRRGAGRRRGRPTGVSRNGRGLVFRYLDDPRRGRRATRRSSASGARATRSPSLFPSGARRPHPDPDDGPPGRGPRGARPTPRATGRASCASTRAPPSGSPARPRGRSCARPVRRPPSSARPRVRAGRSPGTRDTSRTRSPARACATRCGPGRTLAEGIPPGTRRPGRGRRRDRVRWRPRRDRERLPAYHFANADTRVERQSPGAAPACPRRGPHAGARSSATCSGVRARRSRSPRSPGSPAPPARRWSVASARGGRRSCAPPARPAHRAPGDPRQAARRPLPQRAGR